MAVDSVTGAAGATDDDGVGAQAAAKPAAAPTTPILRKSRRELDGM
jgi:hypothetical protein